MNFLSRGNIRGQPGWPRPVRTQYFLTLCGPHSYVKSLLSKAFSISTESQPKRGDTRMKKIAALVATIAFFLGVGLAVPPTFAQTPAPKEEKKGEMTDKKGEKSEKKSAKKKSEKKDKTEKAEKKDEKK